MTWADTAWGEVCAAAHARVQLLAGPGATEPYFPSVVLGIGVDEYAKHDKGRPSLAFVGPGRIAGDEQLEMPTRGAHPNGRRAVRDRVVPVRCRVFVPFAKTNNNVDTSPERAELLYGLTLSALDAVAHGRACSLNSAAMAGGTTGTDGTSIVLAFTLRITVYAPALLNAKPASTEVAAVAAADPAGEIVATMVPGDA